MEINILQKKIHKNAISKGFYDKGQNFGTSLMLVVSELGEAIEAHRHNEWCDMKAFNEVLISEQFDFETCFKKYVKDTVQDEVADAFIRILDMCEYYGIDLQKHVELKMEYNAKRERLHGKKY